MSPSSLPFIRGGLALGLGALLSLAAAGCTASLGPAPASLAADRPIVFGRVLVLLLGPTTRWYEPQVEFIEVEHRQTSARFRLWLQSDDRTFRLNLPAGSYQVTRVQIHEGPHVSMADFTATFEVGPDSLTYLGTWRFGLESPRYGRMVVLSLRQEEGEQAEAERELVERHPFLAGRPVVALLPEPASAQTRLYEVRPYPNLPRYFMRHWW